MQQNEDDLLAGEEAGTDYDGPSKSQVKREMLALQALGEELAGQSLERLRTLDLPEKLMDAFIHVKSIKAHGAVRRQLQFIGKLMRTVDPAPLRQQLDIWSGHSREGVARQHQAEHWRERLIEQDDALTGFLSDFPEADIPALRQIIRNARKEKEEGKPPKHFRELYRSVLTLIEAQHRDQSSADESFKA
jgi:ribosome-associated protein